MQIFDLSHVIDESMPVYPGTDLPKIKQKATVAGDGYNEKKLSLTTHIGTHIDAPAHMLEKGARLDQMPVGAFYGRAAIIDVTQYRDNRIELDFLQAHRSLFTAHEYILFYTGYDNDWQQNSYFKGFPVLTEAAAKWLVGHGLKGIGLDACSVDPVGSENPAIHHILFNAGLLIVENLTNLYQLQNQSFTFCCFPLKIRDADGSPVRAVAISG